MPVYQSPALPNITPFDASTLGTRSLILASASPRRRDLLSAMGLPFILLPCDADESIPEGLTPCEAVGLLSVRKAYAALPRLSADKQKAIILAADTIVDFDGMPLGKPKDRQDAFNTLTRMAGARHEVHTGVTVLFNGRLYTAVDTSTVYMRPCAEKEIEAYVDSGECMGKAGSYAIQGEGGKLVERFDGMLDNIIGLPTKKVALLLSRAIEDDAYEG